MSSPVEHGGSLRLYRRLLTYALPYKWGFVVAVIGMVLFGATGAGFAALMKPLVDEGFVNRDPAMLGLIPPLIVGLFVLRAISNLMAEYSINWVGRRVIFDLRNAIFRHMMYLPSGFYERHASGTLISRLIFDVEQVSAAVTQVVFSVVRDGVTVIALFIWMLYLNWLLTLVLAFTLPVSLLLIRLMSRRFRKTSREIQLAMGEISRVTQEATEGQRVVKAFGGHETEIKTFGRANERNRRQAMRRTLVSALGVGLIQLLAAVGLALVIAIALSAEISAGVFVSYITATTWMFTPTKSLARINEVIQTGLVAAQSAFNLLDEPAELDTGTCRLERARGRIEYRRVRFRYPATEADALDDVSFTVEPGQTLALVGASGSGKTTAVNLLPRFYRPEGGEILLDDININEIVLTDLRRQIAVVGQETLLFDDTIAHNIAYGAEGPIDNARLQQAARAAHVIEFAERLPEGLDTSVGEKGMRLSGGQRQRVAIARALYKNAPILILDEATSALDSESERYVQDAMQKLMRNRTTLVIAHRLSTVEHADRIVVLSKGRVFESGNHAELLARGRAYASLYRSQFSEPAA